MSLKKYVTFEEAEVALWKINLSRNNLKEIFAGFRLKRLKAMPKCPRGIFRYKTIQDAAVDAGK